MKITLFSFLLFAVAYGKPTNNNLHNVANNLLTKISIQLNDISNFLPEITEKLKNLEDKKQSMDFGILQAPAYRDIENMFQRYTAADDCRVVFKDTTEELKKELRNLFSSEVRSHLKGVELSFQFVNNSLLGMKKNLTDNITEEINYCNRNEGCRITGSYSTDMEHNDFIINNLKNNVRLAFEYITYMKINQQLPLKINEAFRPVLKCLEKK